MPACRRTSGLFAPTVRQRRNRHVRIGEKPAIADELRATPTGQPAHADRGMRNHTFQQRSPPLSRRRSPNQPTDHSISSRAILSIVRLPDASMPCTAAYPVARREASRQQEPIWRAQMCASPRACAGAGLYGAIVVKPPVSDVAAGLGGSEGDRTIRGERALGLTRPTHLYSVGLGWAWTMMQRCASGARLRRRAHSLGRRKSHACRGSPPPRTGVGAPAARITATGHRHPGV